MRFNKIHINIIFWINIAFTVFSVLGLIGIVLLIAALNNQLGGLGEQLKEIMNGQELDDVAGYGLIFGGIGWLLGSFMYIVAIAAVIIFTIDIVGKTGILITARCLIRNETKGRRIAYRILMGTIISEHALIPFTMFSAMTDEFAWYQPVLIFIFALLAAYEIIMTYTPLGQIRQTAF